MPIRILIADDDPTIRMLLRRVVETHPAWQVCGEAANGVEAVNQVEHDQPDVAILDLGMPLRRILSCLCYCSVCRRFRNNSCMPR